MEGRAVRCVHDRRSWLESDYFLDIVTAEDLVDAAEDTGDIVMDMADADKVAMVEGKVESVEEQVAGERAIDLLAVNPPVL